MQETPSQSAVNSTGQAGLLLISLLSRDFRNGRFPHFLTAFKGNLRVALLTT
jgi:hypothetical protein